MKYVLVESYFTYLYIKNTNLDKQSILELISLS